MKPRSDAFIIAKTDRKTQPPKVAREFLLSGIPVRRSARVLVAGPEALQRNIRDPPYSPVEVAKRWFEISHEGWRGISSSRPLGRLLLEAVQNAFDEQATTVAVDLSETSIVIEDDAVTGFGDERLVYTLFLSDKRDDPTRRGRMGRGLKELIAAMESARVDTVGTTIEFTPEGRTSRPNDRTRGTRLILRRKLSVEERDEAAALLRMVIAPKGTTLRVRGKVARRPRRVLALSSCDLETVLVRDGVERAVTRVTSVSLYTPRKGEQAFVFEMGIPVEPWDVPWHCDVAQRVPLLEGRDGIPDRYKLHLKAALLDAMIGRYLDKRDLKAEWVHDVIARFPVKPSLLEAYVSRVFPRGAVLGGTSRANDRARQLGAHVIDTAAISHGAYMALGRVLETADDHVKRRSVEFGGEDVEPDETQKRFADAVRWLARRVAGRVVRVRFFARDTNDAGLLEDAVTDVDARIISFNVRGPLSFANVLEPHTLGVVLHEVAHLETPEHDHRFIDRLQYLAGQTARVLGEGGPALCESLRRGDPDHKVEPEKS